VLPAVARTAGNAKLLATVLCEEPSPTFRRAFPEIDTTKIDPRELMSEMLAGWNQEREVVVLSAENFRPGHAPVLRALIPAEVACAVVLYVRRQDRWIESYYNQMVKTDEIQTDLETFLALLCDTEGEQFCRPDWYAHYQAWHAAFGNCRIVFYDEARDDLLAAFMAAAELTAPDGLVDIDPAQVALDLHQLAYVLELERPMTTPDFARRRAATEEASRRLGAPDRRSLLTEQQRLRLHQRYDAPNRRLTDALGRSPDSSPLSMTTPDAQPARLADVYASADYAAHRALANAIFEQSASAPSGAAVG
jgi:hypothetical protein